MSKEQFKDPFKKSRKFIIDNNDELRDLYNRRQILKRRRKSQVDRIEELTKSKDKLVIKRDKLSPTGSHGSQYKALSFKIKDMQSDIEMMIKQLSDDDKEFNDIKDRLKLKIKSND